MPTLTVGDSAMCCGSTKEQPTLKSKEVWSIRIRLRLAGKACHQALFNLAIDSELRGYDAVIRHVAAGRLGLRRPPDDPNLPRGYKIAIPDAV